MNDLSHVYNNLKFELDRETTDEDVPSGYARGPIRTLMMAVLIDGVCAYLSKESKHYQLRGRHKEAVNWINSSDDSYVFSYNSVCDALGINPHFMRKQINRLRNSSCD